VHIVAKFDEFLPETLFEVFRYIFQKFRAVFTHTRFTLYQPVKSEVYVVTYE